VTIRPKDTFPRRIRSLEKGQADIFTLAGTRKGYDRIQDGGIAIFDLAGARRAILGKLDDGSYDIAFLDEASGIMLPSRQLLAPPVATDDDPIVFGAETGNLPLGSWVLDQGPSTDVHVYTGAMLVTVSCSMECEGASPVDFWVSIALAGPSALAPDQNRGLHIRFDASSGQSAQQQASREIPLTGLVPGDYTVSVVYKASSLGATPGAATASFRGLIVRAY
jgi:hypothetical protein